MSEAIDQPAAAGVDGPGNAAQTDDHDTEAFDRVEAPDDDEPEPKTPEEGEEGAESDDPEKAKAAAEDEDHVEVERNGQKFKVPKALHGELLMQADYTKKTTEHAQAVRSFEEERQSWESQREQSRAALPEEHAAVAVVSHELTAVEKRLEQFKAVDWETWRGQVQGLPEDDPNRLRYVQYRDAYTAARDSRIDLTDRLEAVKKDLQTKDEARLSTQREEASKALRQAQQETGRVLAAEVEGWNAQRANEVAKFMVEDLRLTPEEVLESTDPRVWKAMNRLIAAEAKVATLEKALKQQQTAEKHAKDQETKPAEKPKGTGGDPTRVRDDIGTDTWMERRNRQLAAKGRR